MMTEREVIKGEPTCQTSKVLGIDVGSTFIKIGLYNPSEILRIFSGQNLPPSHDKRISYSPNVVRVSFPECDPPVLEFRWMDARDFMLPILDSVYQLFSHENSNTISDVVLTGWTNSLVVFYKGEDQFGISREKSIILLEDPELQIKITPSQKEILSQFLGETFADQGLKVSSSVMKLLALKNNPRVIQYLFGLGAKIEDLKFDSMLGLLRHILSGDERGLGRIQRNMIPSADLKGFASVPGKIASEVAELMTRFGIVPDQVIFTGSNIEESQGIEYYTYNDFEANATVITRLISPDVNILPSDLVCVEIGTVAKVFAKDDPQGHAFGKIGKKIGEMVYASQRNGGRVKTSIIDHFIGTMPAEAGNKIIDGYLAEGLTEKWVDNPYLYFPDSGQKGRLFKGNIEISLDPKEIRKLKLSIYETGKIVRAVIRGVALGCREKAEKILKAKGQDPDSTTYYCYGGAPDSIPFRETLAQCFPGRVRHLHLPDSGKSATYLTFRRKGGISDQEENNIELATHEIERKMDRDDEYKRWLQLLGTLIGTVL